MRDGDVHLMCTGAQLSSEGSLLKAPRINAAIVAPSIAGNTGSHNAEDMSAQVDGG